jgi:hypothetical protein
MSRDKDYIPINDAQFDAWQKNLLTRLGKGLLQQWDIPQSAYDALLPLQTEWGVRYAVTTNPDNRTHAQVLVKKEARTTFESALRAFIKAYLTYNPKVADDDREVLGLPVHKTGRRPAPVATDAPDSDTDTSVPGRVTIHFFEKGSNHKKGKPEGQHGGEIAWALSDVPPTRWDELTHSDIDTSSPFTLQFENNQRGKTVYYALRWENTRGEKGPWSEIRSVIIP